MSYGELPPGRGQWRLTLHQRSFAAARWQDTIIAQLDAARSRKLTRAWNTPAELTFTLDGHAGEAKLIQELATDIIAWRWNPAANNDTMMFRGVVDHSEDELSEQTMTTVYVCHDYAAMWNRRLLTQAYTTTQRDQDSIAADLAYLGSNVSSSSGIAFAPGAWLPLSVQRRNPDGTFRTPLSGQLRDRTYAAQSQVYQLFDDLSKVINGFDWEVRPYQGVNMDELTVYYPGQGVTRDDMILQYGSTIASLTRTVSSADYANYVRVLGNNGSEDPAAPQFFSEAWNTDANNVTVNPVGLWMNGDNAADVTIQSTLDQKAEGDLALSGTLTPSYTLTMRPDAYMLGFPNMGDVVPLVVQAGRLHVNTTVRVVGITYSIGDDGQEDVALVVGRPPITLTRLLTQADRDLDALTRR